MSQAAQQKAKAKDSKKGKKKKNKKAKLTARNANKFVLYQRSVQEPEADVRFLTRVYKREYSRLPMQLREDFCGTAYLCSEWVRSHPERTAVGLDLDEPTLEWGHEHNIAPLGEDAERVSLLKKDVLEATRPRTDIAVAFNFSYCIFQQRSLMLKYMKAVKRCLSPAGMFVLDIHGGPESLEDMEECTEFSDFTYVWDQGPIDALSNITHRAIHFRFKDGTQMKNAFRYHWRIWGMPELCDLMVEAGYRRVDIYWEGYDKDGEGNGIFRKVKTAENDESWIAYVVGFP
jgi:SAM-dependent methyltransferase